MNVAVALESRFFRTPDGAVWSLGWLDGTFWQRFLAVFEQVKVIARVDDVLEPPARENRDVLSGYASIHLPEPTTILLLGIASLALIHRRRTA